MRTVSLIAVVAAMLLCQSANAHDCNGQCRTPVRNTVKAAANIVANTVHASVNVVANTAHVVAVAATRTPTTYTVSHVEHVPVITEYKVRARRTPIRHFVHRIRCSH